MSAKLHIRDVQADDLHELQTLYIHLDRHDISCTPEEAAAILDDFLRPRGNAILIGTIDHTLVATCTLVVVPNLTRGGKPYALIENVVTHADWRKRGFGAAILKAAIARAWDHGCYKVMLMTGSKRPETLRFYETVGFSPSKTGFQMRR